VKVDFSTPMIIWTPVIFLVSDFQVRLCIKEGHWNCNV
jgi:hypothetical protein